MSRGYSEDEWKQIVRDNEEQLSGVKREPSCFDCERPYSDGGFQDLIIPYWAWKRISPNGDDSGLLCPTCICKRLHDKKIKCEGAFMSGPIMSVSYAEMSALCRVENIELAIEPKQSVGKRP